MGAPVVMADDRRNGRIELLVVASDYGNASTRKEWRPRPLDIGSFVSALGRSE